MQRDLAGQAEEDIQQLLGVLGQVAGAAGQVGLQQQVPEASATIAVKPAAKIPTEASTDLTLSARPGGPASASPTAPPVPSGCLS